MYYGATPTYNLGGQMPMYAPQPQPMMMAPPPPVYYAPPPVYYAPPPPPPPPPSNQQVIVIKKQDNSNKSNCPHCSELTANIPRRRVGFVAIIWCLVLSTCGLCCIPLLCADSCKDVELLCVKCQTRKSRIQASCC